MRSIVFAVLWALLLTACTTVEEPLAEASGTDAPQEDLLQQEASGTDPSEDQPVPAEAAGDGIREGQPAGMHTLGTEGLQDPVSQAEMPAAAEPEAADAAVPGAPAALKAERDRNPRKGDAKSPGFMDAIVQETLPEEEAPANVPPEESLGTSPLVQPEDPVPEDALPEASPAAEPVETAPAEAEEVLPAESREETPQAPPSAAEAVRPPGETILPSELEEIPVNPLLRETSPEIPPEPPVRPPVTPELAGEILDKEQQLSPPEPERLPDASREEDPDTLLDSSLYTVRLDHLNRLVVSLEGAGWIFLSVQSPEGSSVMLLDKEYDPGQKTTQFLFRLEGDPEDQRLVIMKQDLSLGESRQYVLEIPKERMASQDAGSADPQSGEEGSAMAAVQPADPPPLTRLDPETDTALPVPGAAPVPEQPDPDVREEPAAAVDVESLDAEGLLQLAETYERPGPEQSLEKAREYYLRILDLYPVSLERFKAEERLRYLDRHYFKVQ